MKIIVIITCTIVAAVFLVLSMRAPLNSNSKNIDNKQSPDSTVIIIPETIPAAELKPAATQSSDDKNSAGENETVQPAAPVVSAASGFTSDKKTSIHKNGDMHRTTHYGILRRNIKSGFPDIELDLSPEMTKKVAERYNFTLAVAQYEDSLLRIKAYIANPFGLHPVMISDVSNVSSFSSRPRSDELPSDVQESIKNVVVEHGVWSSSTFFCWLVPNRIEKQIMAIQSAAITTAGYSLKDVAKTIGCYDQDLQIHIEAIETKDGTAVTIESKGGTQ
jgi:hypothetical protein